MLSKDQKKQIVEDLTGKLTQQKAVVFFDYTSLKVNEFQELRAELLENKVECQVVKKSLINLALEKAGHKDIKAREMPGQIALIFGSEDEVLPAKILYTFSRQNQKVKILAGLIEKDYLDETAMLVLAKLPSKQELLAKLVSSIKAPMYGFHNALRGNLQKLLFILKTKSM